MAKFPDVNDLLVGANIWFDFKELLKSGGCTVLSSGTGTSGTYNSSGDDITNAGTGAGGMTRAGAWFRITDPAGLREYVVQCSGTGSQVRILYSKAAKFTGGTPGVNRVPTAADQQIFYGGGTDASPTYAFLPNGVDNSHRYHIIFQSTPVGGVYGFWLTTSTSPGGAAGQGCFVCEPMAPGSYDAADTDPVVHWATATALTATPTPMFWSGATWISAGAMDLIISPGTMLADVHSGKDVNVRPMYTSNAATRIKGWGSYFAVKGAGRNYPITANTASDAYVYNGNFAIPYADNVAPNGA